MAFDPLGKKHKKNFDSIFGKGEYDSGTDWARRVGSGIGAANLLKKRREEEAREAEKKAKEQERLLEAARKEAAKIKREAAQETKKKKENGGKAETDLQKQIKNKERQLKDAGIKSEKKQSKFGKAMHLDKDQNWFMDGLEVMGRAGNSVLGSLKDDAKHLGKVRADVKVAKKKYKAGEITKDEWEDALAGKKFKDEAPTMKDRAKGAKDAFTGKSKYNGSKLLTDAFEMKKGIKRGTAGFALDVATDPLSLITGPLTKGAKAVSKTKTATKAAKAVKEAPVIKPTLGALNDIFSGSRKLKESLTGGTQDILSKLKRETENKRLSMQDRSTDSVASAMRIAGKSPTEGAKVGEAMEAPLRFAQKAKFGGAENVMNSSVLKDMMPDPLSRMNTLGKTDTIIRTADQPLSNGIVPNAQQKLDWGSKKLMDNSILTNTTEGFKDAEVFGQWGTKPPEQVVTAVKKTIIASSNPKEAAEKLLQEPAIRQKYKEAATKLIDSNADIRKFANENGIEVADIEGYMAHFATKEAREHLDNVGKSSSSGTGRVGGDDRVMKRNINDSVKNANIKMKKATGVDEFFTPDAYFATAGGQQRVINFIAAESMKKNVINTPELAKELVGGAKPRKGFVSMTIDGKSYEMTKGAAEGITNFEKHVNDEGINTLLKGYDMIQGQWKKLALFSTGFHIRNAVGNGWNMYLSGMRPDQVIKNTTEAMLHLGGIRKARAGGKAIRTSKEMASQYDEFISQGLKGSGQMSDFTKDLGTNVMSDTRFKTKGTLGRALHEVSEIGKRDTLGGKIAQGADAAFATSRRMGDEADEIARFALFRHARQAGKTPEEAAEKVREVLFDYNDLTKAESEVFRRAIPFYTFMRKNAEFQMKSFMKSPEKFNRLGQMETEAYENSDADKSITPDYLRDAFALPIPGTDRMANFNLPSADLNKMTNPARMLLDGATPLAKMPMEVMMNTQTLNGAPIKGFEGEDGKLFGKKVKGFAGLDGKQWEHVIKGLVSPVRNMSGAVDMKEEGKGNALDQFAQFTGGNVAKSYDQDSFQNQADYTENERLGDLITKAKKQDGKKVNTIAEMKKQGKGTNEDEDTEIKFFKDAGYNANQVNVLRALKKKVYNGNIETSLAVRELLETQGFPEEVIEKVTSDYLEY